MPVTVHPTVALHLPEVTLTGEVRYDPRRDLLEIHYDDGFWYPHVFGHGNKTDDRGQPNAN